MKVKVPTAHILARAQATSINTPINTTEHQKKTSKRTRTLTPFDFTNGADVGLRNGLVSRYISITADSEERQRFLTEECNRNIDEIIRELVYRLMNDDDYEDKLTELLTKLNDDYFDSCIYPDKLLEKRFNKAKDDAEKKVILDLLLLSGGGYSNLLDTVLKNGNSDKRFETCLQYLTGVNDDVKKSIVLSAWCELKNTKQTKNIVRALTDSFGEDYIIATLTEYIEDAYGDAETEQKEIDIDLSFLDGNVTLDEDDEENIRTSYSPVREEEIEQAFNEALTELSERQILLLAVLRNSSQDRTKELLELFNSAISWEIMIAATECAAKPFSRNKKKFADFFYEIAKNQDKKYRPISVGWGINGYSILQGENAPKELRTIIKSIEEPIIAHNFVNSMLTCCGTEGKKFVQEIVTEDIKNNKKSPTLLTLFYIARSEDSVGKEARTILHKALSTNNDVTSFIEMNIDSDVGLVEACEPDWILFKVQSPTIKDLLAYVGIEHWASWMMYDKDEHIRRNARNLFAKALAENQENNNSPGEKHPFDQALDAFVNKGLSQKSRISTDFVLWIKSI